ncbi:amidase [Mycetocola reblochoni]|uniref:Amidase n=2 Tax=Mycetocola reblochoni TaxID=331618 RepID=A0A1R4JT33_9MICO|nr:amidase [Mycetocola reblochoni]RLP70416.1 amidase [Mycetocola reblochoni]SJN35139.1 Amidase [Mycetocola reblochoni REB411]
MTRIDELSAVELGQELRRRSLGAAEVAEHYLRRIDESPVRDALFTAVTAERALERARALDAQGPTAAMLWGIPLADKDLVNRRGVPTRAGSAATPTTPAERSDLGVEVLDRAGAVSLGKTATPEFGLHAYTMSDIQPPAPVPWLTGLNAGGSSGGAAAAVAARLLPFASGSDGGGSIRIPAAATGLIGLKPTRGLVPGGDGVGSLGGLAVQGPLARTAEDAALLLEAMLDRERHRGVTPHDTSLRSPEPGDLLSAAVRGAGRLRIGMTCTSPWDDWCDIDVAPEAVAAFELAAAELAAVGHELEELPWRPSAGYAEHFRVIWRAGIGSVPFGEGQRELLQPITRQIWEAGRSMRAADVVAALAGLTAFERATVAAFAPYDAVLTPAMAMTPRPHDWYDQDDMEVNFRQQVQYTPFTSFVNVAGLPAISLPVAESADGVPMAAHLIGRPGGEAALLGAAAQLQRRLRWHERRSAAAPRRP